MTDTPTSETACAACGGLGMTVFHEQTSVPVNSCLLVDDRRAAEEFPTGRLRLAFCPECGFIGNLAFDPERAEYSARYEETQAYSPRFVDFARGLARTWVDSYGLAGKHVVEIGCGKGEFLVLLAEAGIGSGLGIDPGVDVRRIDPSLGDTLEWRAEFFDADFGPLEADAVVCRHSLEHIPDVGDFVRLIRRAIGDRDTVVLFDLPDVKRVLDEVAFWDVYYEHCSYFSLGSLGRLFERSGFEILELYRDFDDQYLVLAARPVGRAGPSPIEPPDDRDELRRGVVHFGSSYDATIADWGARLEGLADQGRSAVLWGAGSKAVAFLTALAEKGASVDAAVDINPHKWGTYIAGTGHRIIGPEALPALDPDLVVVMNPVYVDEIRGMMEELGVDAEVSTLDRLEELPTLDDGARRPS